MLGSFTIDIVSKRQPRCSASPASRADFDDAVAHRLGIDRSELRALEPQGADCLPPEALGLLAGGLFGVLTESLEELQPCLQGVTAKVRHPGDAGPTPVPVRPLSNDQINVSATL